MKLREIDFGPILDASGVEGFFGEGYIHHELLRLSGLHFYGSTFVAKTTTLNARLVPSAKQGNMPMTGDGLRPKEFSPRCILPNFHYGNITLSMRMFRLGIMLNAVGLSGPGAKTLFETRRWQQKTEPFFISFMSVASTPKERLAELEQFVALFAKYLPDFNAPVGLQINFSCPNVGLDTSCLVAEVTTGLDMASALKIPQMPKFNILTPVETAKKISEHTSCDAICVSNTIPWGKLPDKIDWKGLFGSDVSPLAEFGGGGLSGAPLLPLVAEWVLKARKAGLTKPINVGGGILSPEDVTCLREMGASSVFIGSVANLRPWRVQSIIQRAYEVF
ncbi:MAG: hypothetical protein NTY04_03120 [Candidatus Staskawiczbacteria bacterium]|nr:hypothetical protein [Candidatus Staskawiczbacteria bacterium]